MVVGVGPPSRRWAESSDGQMEMRPGDTERYARQIRLPQVGEAGQLRLLEAKVLIVGVGGLGSPAAMYLAAAGVGHLVLNDFDRVDASNLQRQIVHRQEDIGASKVESARSTLAAINPGIQLSTVGWQLDGGELDQQVAEADVVLDCSDNFPTRFALNAACMRVGTPLVSGAAIRMEGQVTTYIPEHEESPCYRCLYDDTDEELAETCAAEGVVAPLVGIVGSIQAMEALKLIAGIGQPLCGRLLLIDALYMDLREVRLPRQPGCPVCATRGPY